VRLCPGDDEVTVGMLRSSGPKAIGQVREMLRLLWKTLAEKLPAAARHELVRGVVPASTISGAFVS